MFWISDDLHGPRARQSGGKRAALHALREVRGPRANAPASWSAPDLWRFGPRLVLPTTAFIPNFTGYPLCDSSFVLLTSGALFQSGGGPRQSKKLARSRESANLANRFEAQRIHHRIRVLRCFQWNEVVGLSLLVVCVSNPNGIVSISPGLRGTSYSG
jgi:hypothetical protein